MVSTNRERDSKIKLKFCILEKVTSGKNLWYQVCVCLISTKHSHILKMERDGERLRVIPNCCHAFHIDCFDIWLQKNANCPLCRSGISPSSILHSNVRIFLPLPPPQYPPLANAGDNFAGDEDDFMVLEIEGNNLDEQRLVLKHGGERKKVRKLSMGDEWIDMREKDELGDEWIDMREKDEEFQNVQPIRRLISMDLSVDRANSAMLLY